MINIIQKGMTMERLELIKKTLQDMDECCLVSLWNDYCTYSKQYTDYIRYTSELDEIANYDLDRPLSEIVSSMQIDFADYSDQDTYYNCDVYEHYCSFNHLDQRNSPFDYDTLAEAIDDGNVDVSDYSEFDWLLDEEDNEEE